MQEIAIPEDGQFALDPVTPCNPVIRGTAICNNNRECSKCPFAKAYLNPDIPLYVLLREEEDNK